MYEELYSVWRNELENQELGKLPPDFYVNLALYVRKLREESRMLERRSAKALLLGTERQKAETMITGLIKARFRKINLEILRGGEITAECLTKEEKEMTSRVSSIASSCSDFVKNLLKGSAEANVGMREARIVVLRFLRDVPEIIGTDMRSYGPYQVEDIGSVPTKNAAILIDRKLAVRVDVR